MSGDQTSEPPWGPIGNSGVGPEVSSPFEDLCPHAITKYFLCPGCRVLPGTHSHSQLPRREGTGEGASMSSCEEHYVWAVGGMGRRYKP